MRLYNLRAGMNPRRVRIFLAEKTLELPLVEIDLSRGEHRTPEFLSLNPLGKLPVLQLEDGTAIAESMAICRYLEALHPEPNLLGRDPLEAAQIEMWNRRMEFELLKPMGDQFGHLSAFFADRITQVPAWGHSARAHAYRTLDWLDAELAERPYIAGSRYTVADITAQCAIVLGKNTGAPLPADKPHLSSWWDRVSQRPTARA